MDAATNGASIGIWSAIRRVSDGAEMLCFTPSLLRQIAKDMALNVGEFLAER
jgi:hypothetical protein